MSKYLIMGTVSVTQHDLSDVMGDNERILDTEAVVEMVDDLKTYIRTSDAHDLLKYVDKGVYVDEHLYTLLKSITLDCEVLLEKRHNMIDETVYSVVQVETTMGLSKTQIQNLLKEIAFIFWYGINDEFKNSMVTYNRIKRRHVVSNNKDLEVVDEHTIFTTLALWQANGFSLSIINLPK